MTVAFLLVTCCMEQTRTDVLAQVLQNLSEQAPELRNTLTVFDNASTIPGVVDDLRNRYARVYRADKNVGYWSAVDWWLDDLSNDPPNYVYIIESDVIHRQFNRIWECAAYLDRRPQVGGVRVHEYSVADKRLYDKDHPVEGSKRDAWRSHTNTVTKQPVELVKDLGDVWAANFNAHLPALNRYSMLVEAFSELRSMPSFTEHDFQRICYSQYQQIAVLDGGINYELAYNGSNQVGSFMPTTELRKLGYQTSRLATIVPRDQYTVARV